MFNKILIATDLSAASDQLINCIKGIKQLGTEEVILFHALRIRHLEYLKFDLVRDAEPFLLKQKSALESFGFKTEIEIGAAETIYELNNTVEKNDVSLIVIGTHGKSLLKHALVGGEATKIMQGHGKPLFVVRIKADDNTETITCDDGCLNATGKILYATDFSDTADIAFTYVEKMVEKGWRRVTLIHVQDSSRIEKHLKERLDEFNMIDDERLKIKRDTLIKKGATDVDVVIPYGLPVQEIIKASGNDKYSMIVMGSQGRGFIKELFLGSVSHNVVRHSHLPVLLIPALR